jgi:hypothetical protein
MLDLISSAVGGPMPAKFCVRHLFWKKGAVCWHCFKKNSKESHVDRAYYSINCKFYKEMQLIIRLYCDDISIFVSKLKSKTTVHSKNKCTSKLGIVLNCKLERSLRTSIYLGSKKLASQHSPIKTGLGYAHTPLDVWLCKIQFLILSRIQGEMRTTLIEHLSSQHTLFFMHLWPM